MDTTSHAAALGLKFAVANDERRLVAMFKPSGRRIDANTLRRAIAKSGYSDWFLFDDAIIELIEKYNTATKPGVVVIGERRDALVEIEVSRDKMSAYLHVEPPYGGGKPVTGEQIQDALNDNGITFGIIEGAIEEVVAKGEVDNLLIAQGKEPVHGENTQFVSILPEVKERRPRIGESGEIDYRELGDLQMVNPGDRLMKRVPATLGEPGTNILGEYVPAKAGKNFDFAKSLSGVKRAPDDLDVLVAEIYGQPVVVDLGMIVDPTLVLQKVDLSTGNIAFEGTVKVEGNICPGMKVTADGDVYVAGLVEAAKIEAGGDVVVSGGIIGHGDLHDEAGRLNTSAAIVTAKGSVSANFIENAQIYAGGDILVKELVTHSELEAEQQVVVGKRSAKKGAIIGGVTKAYMAVKALMLGSPLAIATKIYVGDCKDLEKKYNEALLQLEEAGQQREKVQRVLKKLAASGQQVDPKMVEKANATVASLHQEMMRLTNETKLMKKQLEVAYKARVVVGARAYANVHITIRDKYKCNKDERSGGAFYLEGYDMVFGWSKSDKVG